MAQIPANPNPGGAGGAGGGATPPSNTGRAARAFGGILHTVGAQAFDWTSENVDEIIGGLKDLLRWSILVPMVLFFIAGSIGQIGVVIGGSAEWWLVGTCGIMTTIGGALGALLVTLLWTRLVIYGKAAALALKAAEATRNAVTTHKNREAERFDQWVEGFLVWARGWTAWYISALMFFMWVPYYRNLLAAAGALMVMLLMAAIFSAQWSQSTWAKQALVVGAVLAGVTCILMLVWPAPVAAARVWSGNLMDGIVGAGDRESRIQSVEQEARERENITDAQRLTVIRARQHEIQQNCFNNADQCESGFLNADERDEYLRLESEARAIRSGSLRQATPEKRGESDGSTGLSKASSEAAPSKRSAVKSGGRLPPPPRVTPTPRGNSRPRARARSSGRGSSSKAPPASSGEDFGMPGIADYQF